MRSGTAIRSRISKAAVKAQPPSAAQSAAWPNVVADRSTGWVSVARPFDLAAGQDPLSLHHDWKGPVKLVERTTPAGRTVEKRFEFFLADRGWRAGELALEPERVAEHYGLLTALYDRAAQWAEADAAECWNPPPAETVTQWLQILGHEPMLDEQGHLRMTLNRIKSAGQMRVTCGGGQLRFSLPLGRWNDLSPAAEAAMRRLATLANHRIRLARIVWIATAEQTRCCEARVDLSGLPWLERPSRTMQGFWQGMMLKAVNGLEAALHQLGLELELLALPQYENMARRLAAA